MILFFDTETTGLPDKRMPLSHECQPHPVQLACLLTDHDGTERAQVSLIVRPSLGVTFVSIPAEAARVHGIDYALAERCGVSETMALSIWDRLARSADTIVAHNLDFDLAIMETAWLRYISDAQNEQPTFDYKLRERTQFCTMAAATPLLNLPPTNKMLAVGINKPKPPKLEECVQFFFNEQHEKAHDAMADVRACARIYFHMKTLERVPA